MTLRLYALEGCPYCERVHDVLEANDVTYETQWTEALHSERDEVKRISGQRAVPVLVDEARGVTMAESENIVRYVETTLGGES